MRRGFPQSQYGAVENSRQMALETREREIHDGMTSSGIAKKLEGRIVRRRGKMVELVTCVDGVAPYDFWREKR